MASEYDPGVPKLLATEAQRAEDDSKHHRLAEIAEARANQEDERRFRRNQRRTNTALVMLAAITGVGTLWQGYLTREAIKAANRQAKASEYANQLTSQNIQDSAAQSERALTDNRAQTQKLEENSRRALQTSIQALQLDQRPWLGVTGVEFKSFERGKQPVFSFWIENNGKTVASDVTLLLLSKLASPSERIDPGKDFHELGLRKNTSIKADAGNFTIFPDEKIEKNWSPFGYNVAQENFNRLDAGDQILYFAGECKYVDIFKQEHVTEFCYRIKTDSNSSYTIQACEQFNRAN